MRESRTYGSVRGALSNGRPYRVPVVFAAMHESAFGTSRRLAAVPNFGRDRVKADMPPGWQAYRSDENDPNRSLG
jgi:hypothetical protein